MPSNASATSTLDWHDIPHILRNEVVAGLIEALNLDLDGIATALQTPRPQWRGKEHTIINQAIEHVKLVSGVCSWWSQHWDDHYYALAEELNSFVKMCKTAPRRAASDLVATLEVISGSCDEVVDHMPGFQRLVTVLNSIADKGYSALYVYVNLDYAKRVTIDSVCKARAVLPDDLAREFNTMARLMEATEDPAYLTLAAAIHTFVYRPTKESLIEIGSAIEALQNDVTRTYRRPLDRSVVPASCEFYSPDTRTYGFVGRQQFAAAQ